MATLVLMPRRAGKSNMIIYEFFKNKEPLIVVPTMDMKNHIHDRIRQMGGSLSESSIITGKSLLDFKGHSQQTLLIDEYCFMPLKVKEAIHKLKDNSAFEDIIAFSTPNRLYPNSLFRIVDTKKHDNGVENVDINDVLEEYLLQIPFTVTQSQIKEIKDIIYELKWDFLTSEDVKKIKYNNLANGLGRFYPGYTSEEANEYRDKHGEVAMRLEFLNSYIV